MSIRVEFSPEYSNEQVELPPIAPGQAGSFSDFTNGNRDIISAICNQDDKGGLVYRFPNEDFPENNLARVIPLDAYTDDRVIAEIGWCRKFETDITTETRRHGRLILIHTVLR